MINNLPVKCLINRSWDTSTKDWEGDFAYGTLIYISTQSTQDNSGKVTPVGIVLLADDTFQCVPMEFITKSTN